MTGPAITRKQNLHQRAVKANVDLRVVSIEPLGEAMQMYDISTGTGDFIANGLVIQTGRLVAQATQSESTGPGNESKS